MPPRAKFSKEEIIQASLDLVRENGIEGVNARAVGQRLGTSPSPIFTVFATMDELKSAVFEAAKGVYHAYTDDWPQYSPPAKHWAMQMVRFSMEEPKLFQLLFMQEQVDLPLFDKSDMESVHGMPFAEWGEAMHLTPEQSHTMFYNLWIFLYGICTMCARKVCSFTQEEIAERIGTIFAGQLLLIRSGQSAFTQIIPQAGENSALHGMGPYDPPYTMKP